MAAQTLSVASAPVYRQALLALVASQWPDMKSLAVACPEIDIPAPLIALNPANELLGGLVFGQYAHPQTAKTVLWINALVVRESARRQGIASNLVSCAELEARAVGAREQFVLTNYPGVYQKVGWRIAEQTSEGMVLSFQLDR